MKTASGQEWAALESVKCVICEQDNAELLFQAQDFIYGNEGTFPMVKCRTCGLAYLNPKPSQSEGYKFYPGDYFSFRPPSIPTPPAGPFARMKRRLKAIALEEAFSYPPKSESDSLLSSHPFIRQAVAKLLTPFVDSKKIPPFLGSHRILDVGCGNGAFLLEMGNLGWDTYGVERNPSIAAYVRKNLHLKVHAGTLETIGFNAGFFDVVTFWDSLEHLANPLEVLKETSRILSPTGLLIISTPNFNCLLRKIFQEKWFNVAAPLHYYLYTRETLNRLVEKVGFYIHRVRYPLGTAGLRESMEIALLGRIRHDRSLAKALLRRLFSLPHQFCPGGHLVAYAKRKAPQPGAT